jgi:3-phytase
MKGESTQMKNYIYFFTNIILFKWICLGVFSLTIILISDTPAQVTVVNPTIEYNASGIVDQDDMCIWIHPINKSLSTVISSDKTADKLFVYDLEGNVLQTIAINGQRPGNIDVRYNFPLAGEPIDIVGYNRRSGSAIVIYKIDRETRLLSLAGSFSTVSNYGFSLYKSPSTGKYYGFISDGSSTITQYELSDNDNDGIIECTYKRPLNNGSGNTEGIVADDETGILYAANETSGIYKFDADPDNSNERTLVAQTGTNGLTQDVEGLTIYYASDGEGYLIASSQGSDNFKIYERKEPHNFVKTIDVTGVGDADGIDVSNLSLGSSFPNGLFLTHDGTGSPYVIRGCKWEDLGLTVDTDYWDPRTSPFVYTPNTFAVIGDFGSADDNATKWVADMVKSWNPEYVITTGDNSYDNTSIDDNIGQFYSKFMFPYDGNYPPASPDKNRFWVSVGNHDYSDGGGITAQKEYFPYLEPNTYYDIEIGCVHFFMLDSDHFSSYSGSQKTWFDNAVSNSDSRWRIAVFHEPPYTSGTHYPNTDMMNWPFDANGFNLVFNGHNHNMEHLTVSGQNTNYIVQGAGGRSLYSFGLDPSPATSVWKLSEYGACKVIVTEDNITVEFWTINATVPEHSFTLTTPLPVELTNFGGEVLNDKIKLEWRTETEVNNYGFEILRSTSIKEWSVIGFVAGHGNSNSPRSYSFIDENVISGNYAYRLKQIDSDGNYDYSKVINIKFGLPLVYQLSQNYPNPFNPVTKIKYSLPITGTVQINLYNTLGEQIDELLNEEKEAGNYSVSFNGINLPSGIYLYRFTSGQFSNTKKMILLK